MAPLLKPGDRYAGHEIIRHLGDGERSVVYAARGPTGELRALKIMTPAGDRASKLRARFSQEGEVLTLIVHAAVVRIYDTDVCGDDVYLSLELVEGETLAQKLRAGGRPSLEDILHWIQQACEGVAEAHRVGVVHRDLMPDNILVTSCGAVKVIDFGIAKLRKWGVNTTTDRQIGAIRYGSPEAMRGSPAAESMDVYSMGQILYEQLAREHPMGAEPRSVPDTVNWQVREHPRPLREIAPWVPSDLAILVHQMMEKDPGKRPATMRDVVVRLRNARARLRVPQRRVARNLPGQDRDPVLDPTGPMPVRDEPEPACAQVAPAPSAHARQRPARPACRRTRRAIARRCCPRRGRR